MRYKARLVVKEFLYKVGVDYGDIFSLVAIIETMHVVVALAISSNWRMHQLDVKASFLNGSLEEDVYIQQLVGFVVKSQENKVHKLRKALCGLK